MADYAIGDVQGCYDALLRLLESIQFNDREDKLWFVGDLVNRGPQSLAVLRFIQQLPIKPRITLGNHDLHLLCRIFGLTQHINRDDTLQPILDAPDREALGHWLRSQSILIHDKSLKIVMSHAGIPPVFTLEIAKSCAAELETVLSGEHFRHFLSHMYGNEPTHWEESLTGIARLRFICNGFTRMRFCDVKGNLTFNDKGTIANAAPGLYPWFLVPNRYDIDPDIVFGHWAALNGQSFRSHLHALDTGCYWGGQLTALRLQDKRRFAVKGEDNSTR